MRKRNQHKNSSGNFGTSKEVMLRDNSSGRWIKRSEEEIDLSKNLIPKTLIQVIQNNINYTDTSLIIRKIIECRGQEKIQGLETSFNNIIDSLDNYRAYSVGVEKVFNNCETGANEFDNEIRRMSQELDTESMREDNVDNFLSPAKAYLKILFTYLYSAITLHKEKVQGETVIYGKLKNLKSYIQDLLERILIPSRGRHLDYSKSLYPMFIYNKEFNIEYIETLARYDRRFESPLKIIREINFHKLSVGNYSHSTIRIDGEFEKIGIDDIKVKFMTSLIGLLSDIERLENIRKEVSDIEDRNVLIAFEHYTNQG